MTQETYVIRADKEVFRDLRIVMDIRTADNSLLVIRQIRDKGDGTAVVKEIRLSKPEIKGLLAFLEAHPGLTC